MTTNTKELWMQNIWYYLTTIKIPEPISINLINIIKNEIVIYTAKDYFNICASRNDNIVRT